MDPFNPFCLAAVVFVALILPLYASTAFSELTPAKKKSSFRLVWASQVAIGVGGLIIPLHPSIGLAVALVSCLVGIVAFRRQVAAATESN